MKLKLPVTTPSTTFTKLNIMMVTLKNLCPMRLPSIKKNSNIIAKDDCRNNYNPLSKIPPATTPSILHRTNQCANGLNTAPVIHAALHIFHPYQIQHSLIQSIQILLLAPRLIPEKYGTNN